MDTGRAAAVRMQLGVREGEPALVPLERVLAVRDGLSADETLEQVLVPPFSPALRTNTSISLDPWSLHAESADYLLDWMGREGISRVLEFGSGVSTALFATVLRASVLSIEQSAGYAEKTRALCAAHGVAGQADVRVVGLTAQDISGERTFCYAPDEAVRQAIRDFEPQFVVVDGPSLDSGASRFGVAPLVAGLIPQPALLVLDDAWRDAELDIATRWSRLPGIRVDGIVPVGKGMVVGSVGPG